MEKGTLSLIREEAKEYWEGLAHSKLRIQQCKECKKHVFYPRQHCPHDMGELEYVDVSGKGKVLSYTIIEKAVAPHLQKLTPFAMAIIELQEGPTMMSRIVGADPYEVEIDQKVEIVFEKFSPEISLPLFQPTN
ncbi:Zn-ribbon domain-containing OB-fold protein [Peribacillus frigoritolerans]|uniref:Zn-ribbon domain-containing OB-fold protein n=1 Tax=Peribacillus frigoritolerans TaxID=450367 RepID=UPI0037F37E91